MDWKTVGKIAVGGLIIAGLGVATVLTGGAAAGIGGTIMKEMGFVTTNGYKSKRYVDAVEVADNKIVNIYQVGKVSKNGLPVSRESKAIADIMEKGEDYNGAPITFIPYNSDQGPIVYTP